jgi:hypothetical protein
MRCPKCGTATKTKRIDACSGEVQAYCSKCKMWFWVNPKL